MLLEEEGASGEGDVVIGGKEGDQAEGEATDGLGTTKAVETKQAGNKLTILWRGAREFL